jgi:hypothetical protein
MSIVNISRDKIDYPPGERIVISIDGAYATFTPEAYIIGMSHYSYTHTKNNLSSFMRGYTFTYELIKSLDDGELEDLTRLLLFAHDRRITIVYYLYYRHPIALDESRLPDIQITDKVLINGEVVAEGTPLKWIDRYSQFKVFAENWTSVCAVCDMCATNHMRQLLNDIQVIDDGINAMPNKGKSARH